MSENWYEPLLLSFLQIAGIISLRNNPWFKLTVTFRIPRHLAENLTYILRVTISLRSSLWFRLALILLLNSISFHIMLQTIQIKYPIPVSYIESQYSDWILVHPVYLSIVCIIGNYHLELGLIFDILWPHFRKLIEIPIVTIVCSMYIVCRSAS